jgi:pimeloyl-ACP methyl ester carboxylesterase
MRAAAFQIPIVALAASGLLTCAAFVSHAEQPRAWRDPSTHHTKFITVNDGVHLEVLDWGGSGRPIVFLAGGGNTAHVFDAFAPKLTADHHVYGITRRGFGRSGFLADANPIDRLRDDVLAVVSALKLTKPVLIGHSIAGAELSAVATTRPDLVGGLVYLEAGYPYAFNIVGGPPMAEFQASGPRAPNPTNADLASFGSLQNWDAEVYGFRIPEAEFRQTWEADSSGRPRKRRDFPGSQSFMAIMTSPRKHGQIPVPSLVIFASPHIPEAWIAKSTNPRVQDAARTYYAKIEAATESQAKAVQASEPAARVVRLPGAHYIFLSNQPDTLREVRSFLNQLH